MLSFSEFLAEGKKGLTNAGTIMTTNTGDMHYAISFNDETLEVLRRNLYDKFMAMAEKSDSDIINKSVSTIVYCLDKKMRIDADIIGVLSRTINKSEDETSKMLSKEVDDFYGSLNNVYGKK